LCGACSWAEDQPAAPEATKPITLEQALDIAFRQNPDVKVALDQVERSKGGIAEARANFMPKFSIEADHQRQGPPVSFTLPGGGSAVNIVQDQNTSAFGTARLPVDVSNKFAFASDIAKYQYRIDYLNLMTVSEKLIYNVKKSYYDLLGAKGLEDVAQKAVDVANARLKDTNSKFMVGSVAKFDVTRAQVEVANLSQQLITARSGST
jgi:outer membrane protein TolC